MSISEQVKELKELAKAQMRKDMQSILYQAAETIESLSAKLSAANMDRSEDGSGWIPCSERLPEEHDSIFTRFKGTDKWHKGMFEKTSDEVNATVEFDDGARKVKTLHTIDGKWNESDRGLKFTVIAWQPLPEPYHES